MTDLVTPDQDVDVRDWADTRLLREADEVISHAATEISSLDVLWEQEWEVTEDRAYGPQRLDIALPQHSIAQQRVRRALDIVISLVALILLAPLLLALAAAVRLTSDGPALFKQARPGRDGELFAMFKFRSMDTGAERAVMADDRLRQEFEDNDFKMAADDPRITPLGRFLRRSSLDELPQLFNVLRGDMSLVGVRPLLPEQLERRPVQDQMLYKMLRPGMTGLWQVEGRSDVSGDERRLLDRSYVCEWSLVGDVIVLARTPWALVRGSGAQ